MYRVNKTIQTFVAQLLFVASLLACQAFAFQPHQFGLNCNSKLLDGAAISAKWKHCTLRRTPHCYISQQQIHHRISLSALFGTYNNNLAEVSLDTNINVIKSDNTQIEKRQLQFGGVGRLYANSDKNTILDSTTVLERLNLATVAVIGIGGVGSWAAEALCRSGIGNLILVDLDDICISNTNRQVHAVSNNIGQLKTIAMQKRLYSINPACNVTIVHDFVTRDNVNDLLQKQFQGVEVIIDAIDGSDEKSALLAACVEHKVPIVTCGGAAGKFDPTRVVCEDIVFANGDKLMSSCKRTLRKYHGFASGLPYHEMKRDPTRIKKWNISAIFSLEKQKELPHKDDISSFRRCDGALGTACFVTGTFGFAAAARVVDMIAHNRLKTPTNGHSR